MKSFPVLITVFTLVTLISCGPTKKDLGQTQQLPVLPLTQEQTTPLITEPAQVVEDEATEQPSTEQNNTEVMLNPPHGEPYHRCDIAVGAPLSSAPANTPQARNSQVQAPIPQPSAPALSVENNPTAPTIENARRINPSQARSTASANNGSKPTLNPAHGQPFHRCDIPVGNPLP
ncbi:hypothetical protein [uncultured Sunxiuqinia sp.]|uniref:hypothetical protein n=1 Tax=uncultured Sunxiuqinia sp. TaxID=1573825 RepID=UPI0030D860FB|tara:strand:- start:13948 stop:14472 length:525 start_codon:yes stop_codon:yes gene_type:complete